MEGDCNVYAHSSLWMRPTGEWSINAKMVYTLHELSWENIYDTDHTSWMRGLEPRIFVNDVCQSMLTHVLTPNKPNKYDKT